MNIILTDLRSNLLIKNVSKLMFIQTNGPPIDKMNFDKYVKLWLENHRSATDTQRKNFLEPTEAPKQDLWALF